MCRSAAGRYFLPQKHELPKQRIRGKPCNFIIKQSGENAYIFTQKSGENSEKSEKKKYIYFCINPVMNSMMDDGDFQCNTLCINVKEWY